MTKALLSSPISLSLHSSSSAKPSPAPPNPALLSLTPFPTITKPPFPKLVSVHPTTIGTPFAVARELQSSFVHNSNDSGPDLGLTRIRFESMIRNVQQDVCRAIEIAHGRSHFTEDTWTRPGGGGGTSCVLQDGAVFEKAAVNVSVVYGMMLPEAHLSATGGDQSHGDITFFATGISSVIHPRNPFAPTLHFNYRYFETESPEGGPGKWWFGGGTDITPSYVFEEDIKHFHQVQKRACDKYDPSFYPRFKKWCDDYFYIKHRGERRGLGGIFFDNLNEYDQEMLVEFAAECANSVIPAYVPIIERRKDMAFTERHKAWQQLRRGRYVEFNLICDRGTTFGLKTGGRTESVLVSLPLTARWEYDHQPEVGSEEWKLLDACINPKEWV